MSNKKYSHLATKKLERSEFEIEAEINADVFERFFEDALKNLVKTAEIPGFRAGKAPEQVVIKNFGEMSILERAARDALDEIYPEIIGDIGIRAIGLPTIAVTKIARGNPLGFRARTAIMPEVTIGDYKKIAREVVEKRNKKDVEKKKVVDNKTENTDGAENLTDETDEKARAAKDARRAEIAEKILESAKIEVPDFFIESELQSMINRFEHDVMHAGLKLDAYLAQAKKTLDDLRKEWRPSAEKKAKLELALAHIARAENIKADEERVKKEVDGIISLHKTADRFQARQFVEHVLKNEAVFEFLENQ